MDEKRDRQIGFRTTPKIWDRLSAAAKRDRITIATLSQRLVEWSLPHCEQVETILLLERPELNGGKKRGAK